MHSHIEPWTPSASKSLTLDANGDEKTDYLRWRLVDDHGRQTWRYLETDEENADWPQTAYDKQFLGLDTGLPDLPQAQTPLQAAQDGMSYFSQLQLPSGQWASECKGPVFVMPCVVIAWYVTDTPIPAAYAGEMRRYVFAQQRAEDGGWGWHSEETRSSAIGTALSYVVLRLLGASRDDPRLVKARALLHALGGATHAPGIAKFWLCVLGVMKWECVNPFLPEFWLTTDSDPVAPSKWYLHTRINFTSLSYIWSKQWSYSGDDVTQQLKDELYTEPYDSVNFAAHRTSLAAVDNNYPKWWLVNLMNWLTVAVYIPYLRKPATAETAERKVWDLLRAEDHGSEHVGLSPVSKCINLIACHIHDGTDSDSVQVHRQTMARYLWMTKDGMACHLLEGVQVWDTSHAAQALAAAGAAEHPRFQSTLARAHGFLADHQLLEEDAVAQDQGRVLYPCPRKGGWPFSTKYQGYMISEVTGEALRSVLRLQESPDSSLDLEKRMPERRLQEAIDCLLNLQNDTGGFGVYEKRTGSLKLAWLEMGEFIGRTMINDDYLECTTAVLSALLCFGKVYPAYRAAEIEATVAQGMSFIKGCQYPDGGWYGAWGVCFCYAGMFTLETLALAGETYAGSEVVRRGCDFLVSKQKGDGGWGESYLSFRRREYVQHERSQVVQTAWVCMALMHAGYPGKEPIQQGLRLIMSRQQSRGNGSKSRSRAVLQMGEVFGYSNYSLYWPVRALAEYVARYGNEEL
ncbi:terpenoid cyclases/protein prenyltransferase alpha-alpha toroid [Apiospora hydei]|uniref:Terpene cyclase/mutase family member n=1 Tax=Apiospora hydei TaxID=1337664 RepID=A0ABR1VSZ9_9PEZI